MKYVIFCILLFLNSFLFAQRNFKDSKSDSLRKYSYVLYGLGYDKYNKKFLSFGGTVFFVRKNNHIFLITAKHVASIFLDKKNQCAPILYIKNSKGCTEQFIVLNNNYTVVPTEDSVDMTCMEIVDSLAYKLNSVEKFILPLFKQPDNLDIYGYGMNTYNDSTIIFGCTLPEHFRIPKKSTKYYYDSLYKNDILIGNKFIQTDSSLHGYSGSPIFLKAENSQDVRVMGLFTASSMYLDLKSNERILRGVSMEYVMAEIEKYQDVRNQK